MTRPAAVLWDCDGTLANTEPLWEEIEAAVCAAMGGVHTPRVRDATLGLSMEGTARVLMDAAGRTDLSVDEVSEWLTRGAIERLRDGGFDFMPGAVELLTELDDACLPLGLVSAADSRVLAAVLSRLPRPFFSVVVGGDMVRAGKPDPEGYLMAAREIGVEAAACLVIEDTENGSAAGNASGAWVLAVPSEAPVPAAPRRSFAPSLVGLTVSDLIALNGNQPA